MFSKSICLHNPTPPAYWQSLCQGSAVIPPGMKWSLLSFISLYGEVETVLTRDFVAYHSGSCIMPCNVCLRLLPQGPRHLLKNKNKYLLVKRFVYLIHNMKTGMTWKCRTLLLGRINIQIVAEFMMLVFSEICDTVKAWVSRHFLSRSSSKYFSISESYLSSSYSIIV